jgi:sugar phosphate isomerase/epimerase
MLKVGIHSSVIDSDLGYTLSVMNDLGIKYIDLRDFWGKNIVDLSDVEVRDAQGLIKKHGINVTCISPWVFFKLPLRESEVEQTIVGSYNEHMRKLERAIELAEVFDTNLIRCFSFANEIRFKKDH